MKLYKSYIRPIIEYGSIAFISASKTQMDRLLSIEHNAIRTCLRLPRYIRNSLLHEYASLEPLSVRLIKFNKKLLNIMKTNNSHIQTLLANHIPTHDLALSPLDILGSFHNKQAKLQSMIWWAMKHSFFPPILSSMMKAVPRHHIRPSVQHTSIILKILIG